MKSDDYINCASCRDKYICPTRQEATGVERRTERRDQTSDTRKERTVEPSNVIIISGDKTTLSDDELADRLEDNPSEYASEAAARLRLYGSNLFVETACEEQQKLNRAITKLRRCLEVAEDALEYAKGSTTSDCINDCDYRQECSSIKGCLCEQRINNALAEIRVEGGNDGK